MRWNCPHCEELVTAGIDFETTKKAYVRCAKCNGMALVHRSAVLADYVKARRMEEEAQLEAELHLTQTATANSRMQTLETQIRGLQEKLNNEKMINDRLKAVQVAAAGQLAEIPATMPPLPNSAMISAGAEIGMGGESGARVVTPPPFRPSYEMMEEGSTQSTIAAAPPKFNFTQPPAFLMKPNAIETLERSFAIDDAASDDSVDRIDAIAGTAETVNVFASHIDLDGEMNARIDAVANADVESAVATREKSIRPAIALWIAAALAIGSGAYLYREGKKALAPTLAPAPVADEIVSKANSAVRTESAKPLVIVRVTRAVLRNAPSIEGTAVQTLDRSSAATIVEEKDGWLRIESPKIETADRAAWVRADLVTRLPN